MPDPTPTPPPSPRPRTVNRARLCVELGRSRQWVDARLSDDPSFPVLQRGAQGRPYVFDLAAVHAYLKAEDMAARVVGATTPQARLANIRADVAEHDLADRLGKLVDAEEARTVMVKVVASLRTILDKTVGELMHRHGFSAAVEQDFQASIAATVDVFAADVAKVLPIAAKRRPEEPSDPL